MMAVAFGQIGLSPDTFWDMNPREFFCAWTGYNETLKFSHTALEAHRSFAYGAARVNAAATAMSSKAAQQITNYRFAWESPVQKKPMTYADIRKSLQSLNKARKN